MDCVNDDDNSDERVRGMHVAENEVNENENENIRNSGGDGQDGENDVNENISNNSEKDTVYSEGSTTSIHSDSNRVRKRAKRGEGKKRTKTNRYRPYISRKFREKRRDEINGVEMCRWLVYRLRTSIIILTYLYDTVLYGLVYNICEMYIADCIVNADSAAQFLERLEPVFQRFRLKGLRVKAKKC
jgi:hypothetical protein